ncbi:nucleoredoxin-like [Babylonia areolata]|uniref:nucleoredoxin-like n=1 Tax=Babylonia areolata TaxID=304850 RepID=UPI003FD55F3D
MSSLAKVLGTDLLGKNGERIPTENLKANSLIGLYFSAHWCPPCRAFTPILITCYNAIKASGKKFEIIFVSSDKDQESFDKYFAKMPWLAVPFVDQRKVEKLCQKYRVSGIPTLVLVDNNGHIVTANGQECILGDQLGNKYPWKEFMF